MWWPTTWFTVRESQKVSSPTSSKQGQLQSQGTVARTFIQLNFENLQGLLREPRGWCINNRCLVAEIPPDCGVQEKRPGRVSAGLQWFPKPVGRCTAVSLSPVALHWIDGECHTAVSCLGTAHPKSISSFSWGNGLCAGNRAAEL